MTNSKRLNYSLNQFYNNPIASVSAELLVTIAFTILLAIVAIKPTLNTMANLSDEIETKSKLNDNLQKKVAALSAAQTEFYRWEDKLKLLDTAIPDNINMIQDLKLIEKLAVDHSVAIASISLNNLPEAEDSTKSANQVVNLPISVVATGDYPSIKNFVDALLSNRRIFVINSIIFAVNKERGGKESLSATLSVDIPIYQ